MDKFTEEDIYACWPVWHMEYFLQILNGEYANTVRQVMSNNLIALLAFIIFCLVMVIK